jgi:putative phosphotransacetylase
MNENEKQVIEQIVINTVKKLIAEKDSPNRVVLGISNKHIHLSKKDIETLFGEGYELTNMKDLKQPGQYAAKETVKVIGPKGCFDKVRILGPARPESQIEISLTAGRNPGDYPRGSMRNSYPYSWCDCCPAAYSYASRYCREVRH